MTERRHENRKKIMMAVLAVVLSVVVLIMASLAWYTLSSSPEFRMIHAKVSTNTPLMLSTNNKSYSRSLDISSILSNKTTDGAELPLVPTSTTDGVNWFVCKYDASGDVLQEATEEEAQYKAMEFPAGSTALYTDDNGQEYAATESISSDITQYVYYVYADIYMITYDDTTDVYLSTPSEADYEADETENNRYGSYVMGYEIKKTVTDGVTQERIALSDGDGSETSVRIGFNEIKDIDDDGICEVIDVNGKEYTADSDPDDSGFVIYEPNADKRSDIAKADSSKYNSDLYIAASSTYKVDKTDEAGTHTADYLDSSGVSQSTEVSYDESDGYYYPTYPVKKIGSANGEAIGQESVFPASRLIVSASSTWKLDSLVNEVLQEDSRNLTNLLKSEVSSLDSRCIASFGKFQNTSLLMRRTYADTTYSPVYSNIRLQKISGDGAETDLQTTGSGVKITTLTKNVPKKIRIYFWIEGQDVDCWNDISWTDFLVNLEFTGR